MKWSREALSDQFAPNGAEPRRIPSLSEILDDPCVPSSCGQLLVPQPAFDATEETVHSVGDQHITAIETPRHFVEIPGQVLRRHPMVNADDLTLEERPYAFDPVRVDREIADVLAGRMVDRVVMMGLAEALEPTVLIGHHGRIRRDILTNVSLQGARRLVAHVLGAKFAFALQHAEHDFLTGPALRAALAVDLVLVLLLAADERRVSLDGALEGRIEGLRTGGVTKAMEDKPRRLLRDLEILR